MITLHIPVPPSVNALYFNRRRATKAMRGTNARGRVRTPEYLKWITEAGWRIQIARQTPIRGPVAITYAISDLGRTDLGNLEKAATDLLVAHRLIEDDNRRIVRKITLEWSKDVTDGMRVTVQPFQEGAKVVFRREGT